MYKSTLFESQSPSFLASNFHSRLFGSSLFKLFVSYEGETSILYVKKNLTFDGIFLFTIVEPAIKLKNKTEKDLLCIFKLSCVEHNLFIKRFL